VNLQVAKYGCLNRVVNHVLQTVLIDSRLSNFETFYKFH